MLTLLQFPAARASTAAPAQDLLFTAVTLVALVFSLGIAVAVVFLAVRYRRGSKVDRSNPPQYNHHIEMAWTFIPLAIALGLFAWAAWLYFIIVRIPPNAMEIHVVGKQWMWKLQHPQGRWENNELHVPAGRPIVLTMTSEDVIHSFFVPAFRLKQDVIPGLYTQMWFTATRPGEYPLFCAEFCGTLHSKMKGRVVVMDPADYDRWLREGTNPNTLVAAGERLFRGWGCSGCHNAGSSVRAPLIEGIFGRPRPVQIPRPNVPLEKIPAETIIADRTYIHDSILLPEKVVAAGYRPIMPSFKNRITEEEILQIIAYLKARSPGAGSDRRRTELTQEDYRARTGFVPENMERIRAAGATAPGGTPTAGGSGSQTNGATGR